MHRHNSIHTASLRLIIPAALAFAVAVAAPTAHAQIVVEPEQQAGLPEIPETPLAALDIVLIRPFTLAQPYEDDWRKERPAVRGGVLMVVDLPPEATMPRQVAEPVLLVGRRVAERLHVAWPAGRAVIIVPADLDDRGNVMLDLAKEPIFFGSPELPERVDAAWLDLEMLAAEAAEIVPFAADRIAEARRRGGPAATFMNRSALLGAAALLIREFVPEQDEVAEALLQSSVVE